MSYLTLEDKDVSEDNDTNSKESVANVEKVGKERFDCTPNIISTKILFLKSLGKSFSLIFLMKLMPKTPTLKRLKQLPIQRTQSKMTILSR